MHLEPSFFEYFATIREYWYFEIYAEVEGDKAAM